MISGEPLKLSAASRSNSVDDNYFDLANFHSDLARIPSAASRSNWSAPRCAPSNEAASACAIAWALWRAADFPSFYFQQHASYILSGMPLTLILAVSDRSTFWVVLSPECFHFGAMFRDADDGNDLLDRLMDTAPMGTLPPKTGVPDGECCICLSKVEDSSDIGEVQYLACAHWIHKECALQYLQADNLEDYLSIPCGICRKD